MKRIILKIGNSKGFTVIETLITILLLIIAFVGLASVTVSVIKGNELSKQETTAMTLAKDKMEELKNASATAAGYNALVSGNETNLESIYTRTLTVGAAGTTAPDNDTTKMKKITVTVTWMWNGLPHTVTLNTIISSPGQ